MKEITGYRSSQFLGCPYIALTSSGIKAEGTPATLYKAMEDAWHDFELALKNFLGNYRKNDTIIWRLHPKLIEEDDGCYVVARLLVYPKDIYKILKDKGYVLDKKGNLRFNNDHSLNDHSLNDHSLTENINYLSEEKWMKLLLES